MSTPHEEGYRWPAEWEEHAATWLSWPHNPDTWPGRLAEAEAAFVAMVAALRDREEVCINVADAAMGEHVTALLERAGALRGVSTFPFPTDDAWVRDHGPVFLRRADGARAVVDFRFDAWGRKYPPWDRDDAIPRRVAEQRGLPRFEADFVLEGGSIDGNGQGTILTTEACLLNANREPVGRSRELMEARLRDVLGAERVLWLGDGIVGDDTDGHVDDIARFVGTSTVLAAEEADPSDPNHAPLDENLRRLESMRDACGGALTVVRIPMPPPVVVDGARCPASYVNFYLANGVALVPVFDVGMDERALAILREVLAPREIVPIPGRVLVQGLGAVHCLTQQEPTGA